MHDIDGGNVHLGAGSGFALVVVSSLEVASRGVPAERAERGFLAIDGDAQLVVGVVDLVGELGANWDVAKLGDDLVAIRIRLDSDDNVA